MKRGSIPGYSIAGATFHNKYSTATYVQNNLNWNVISSTKNHSIFSIVIQVGNLYVNNIYNPLIIDWPIPSLKTVNHPAIYIGDFNSHHTSWGYRDINTCGNDLLEWSEVEKVRLVHDAKQKGTFWSARWNKEYNPDLCFI